MNHWLSISMGTHEIPWVPMDLLIDVGAACRTLPTALITTPRNTQLYFVVMPMRTNGTPWAFDENP